MAELGNRLKEARMAKGMSLEDLQTATKIQKRYLVGIEEGNYSMMPGKFYVRAFIKQYAEAVGLEPEVLFEEYKADIPAPVNDDIPEKLSRVQTKRSLSPHSSKILDFLPRLLIGAFVLGALFLLWYLWPHNEDTISSDMANTTNNKNVNFEESANLKENKDTADEENTSAEVEDEEKVVQEEILEQKLEVIETSGKKSIFELKNADKFEVKIVSLGETWVNILNGKGYSFFQGILVKGEETESQTVDFTKETEAVLVIGNTTETEIFVNNDKIDFPVKPTEFVSQEITIRFSSTE